jgi:hypothetical protein
VFNKELEDKQLECQSLAEQRAAVEAMRDYAAAMYQACSGRAWTPTKGSKASHITTASQISALDFLRARAEKRRDRYEPQGPVVVVSGPTDWHDWEIIWNRLDVIHARIPHMALVTTGQRTGVDASAASWAARNGVFCISFDLQGRGKARSARRPQQGHSGLAANRGDPLRRVRHPESSIRTVQPQVGRTARAHACHHARQPEGSNAVAQDPQALRRLTHRANRQNMADAASRRIGFCATVAAARRRGGMIPERGERTGRAIPAQGE